MVSRIDALQRIDEGTIAETQALRVDEDGVTLVKYPSRSQSVFDDNKVVFIRA